MVVDSHTHLGSFPLFNVSLKVDELISIMDEFKIERSVVFSRPNEITFDAVRKHPQRLVGMVWVNPNIGEHATREIDIAVEEWGFKGIKMHPLIDAYLPDQEVVYPIMEKAEKHRVPVLFHCGHPPWSLPWHFRNLADRYPSVTIILGHMGHGHIVYINGCIEVAGKNDNIVLETSGMPMHSKIKEAVDKIGESRVIYGSDMPFGHPAVEILKVKVSGLNETQQRLVLEENAKNIFQL